jgi:hypothetical protein
MAISFLSNFDHICTILGFSKSDDRRDSWADDQMEDIFLPISGTSLYLSFAILICDHPRKSAVIGFANCQLLIASSFSSPHQY